MDDDARRAVMADVNNLPVLVRMSRRIRGLRALRSALDFALFGIAFAVLVVLGAKLGRVPDATARRLLVAALAFPLAGALFGALRPVSRRLAAHLLDKHYALHDRLVSALEFLATDAEKRTPMMEAAIDDAVEHASSGALDPKAALRWRWPEELKIAGGMLALLALVAGAEFRERRVIREAATARGPVDPLRLADDDVRAFRALGQQLERRANTPEARAALNQYQRFMDDVENQRLDRQEAFRRLAELQRAMESQQQHDREEMQRALRELGERMDARNELARQTAESMRSGDPERAAAEMRALAERLRNEASMTQQQRQDLAHAIERAAERTPDENHQRLDQARREVEELLRRQREHALSAQEQSLLRQRQQQAEQLQRQSDQSEQRRRDVEHLQRQIADAVRDLQRNMPQQAANDLEQGAQDLSRMNDQQQSQESMQQMLQRLQELREQMRQQNGQNGQRQREQLQRFFQRANGQGQPGGQQSGQQGSNGPRGQSLGQGQGQGQGPGQRQGQGQGPGRLLLQRGSAGMPAGMGPGQQPGGQQPGQTPGQGQQPGGVQAGTGHDENLRGAASTLGGQTHMVQVNGQQRGNGPTRSQTIRSAASEGFANGAYRDVYNPYWDHAREVLHEGEVPPGYSGYVRRYFQLIRPRDE